MGEEELEMSGVFKLDDVQKALQEAKEDTPLEERADQAPCVQNCPMAQYVLEQIKQDRIRQYQRQREKDQNSLLLMTVILGVPFVYCGIELYNELSSCF